MTQRRTPSDIGTQSYHGNPRGTVNSGNDDTMMHEIDADLFADDRRRKIERPQNYGFSSAVLPRDQQQQPEGQGQKTQAKGASAEAFFLHPGDNRAHPVAVVVDDRRHRPRKKKPGEVVVYDDQKQAAWLSRDAAYFESPKQAVLRHTVHEDDNQQQPGAKPKGGRDMSKLPKVTASVTTEKGKVTAQADDAGIVKAPVITLEAGTELIIKCGGVVVLHITAEATWMVGTQYHGVDNDQDRPTTKVVTLSGPAKKLFSPPG